MLASEMTNRVLRRIGDDPALSPSLMHYTPSEVLEALNQCQRIFSFFSLCLEGSTTLAISSTVARYHILETVADWIAPLRVRIQGGAKLTPARLSELAALNQDWPATQGTPTRYALSGFDLLGVYKQANTTLDLTYARGPVALISTGTPEIPLRYHPALMEGAVPMLRIKEGMQEWQKTLSYWDRFLDAVQDCSEKVKARNRELGYDTLPIEIKRYDMSHLVKKAAN